jgi:hypothetical protein
MYRIPASGNENLERALRRRTHELGAAQRNHRRAQAPPLNFRRE